MNNTEKIVQILEESSDDIRTDGHHEYSGIYSEKYEDIAETIVENLSNIRFSLDFAEWIGINGIRDGQHEWKYKADNYKKKFSTQEMFDEWQP